MIRIKKTLIWRLLRSELKRKRGLRLSFRSLKINRIVNQMILILRTPKKL